MTFIVEHFKQSLRIFCQLFKIAFPILVTIKILQDQFDVITLIGTWLEPVMSMLHLPGEAGIVWATAIFLQLYSAIIVAASLWDGMELSIAQASTLGLLMLVAHGLPVEGRIVQKAGMKLIAALLLRLIPAFLFAWITATTYHSFELLQAPAELLFVPQSSHDNEWIPWLLKQATTWSQVFMIILTLVYFVALLKISRLEALIIAAFAPLLRKIGIGKAASTFTLIGMTLGISYGGGLLIDASQKGSIPKRDLICSLTLLSLTHAVIEDTLLLMLMGGHISALLIARVGLSIVFMIGFCWCIRRLSDRTFDRLFFSLIPTKAYNPSA